MIGTALSGCSQPSENRSGEEVSPRIAPVPLTFSVRADLETPLMDSLGDSADDPAIYVGPDGKGFIAGTDKQSGLFIYNLDGSERAFFKLGTLNNVDLRQAINGHIILAASNDEKKNITVLKYNPASDQFDVSGVQKHKIKPKPYGICLGNIGQSMHVGVTTKAGIFHQYVLSGETLTKVRKFSTRSQAEGCVFDDRTGRLYIAEENKGLFHYPADPAKGDKQTIIALYGEHGLMADLEGVTVYPDGDDGGYLIQSSQGNDSYVVFDLPSHKFAGQFRIVPGIVDGVTHTDGLDVIAKPTSRFPRGFLVVQDNDNNDPHLIGQEEQNFKIIDWRKIEQGLNRN